MWLTIIRRVNSVPDYARLFTRRASFTLTITLGQIIIIIIFQESGWELERFSTMSEITQVVHNGSGFILRLCLS